MAKKKIELFVEIHNEKEFENVIRNNLDQLICAEIYSYAFGYCTALDRLFTTMKMDWSNGKLILLKVPSDEIEVLRRFRDHSEPVYMFILNAKVTKVFRGVDTVKFAEVTRKELDHFYQAQAGHIEDKFSQEQEAMVSHRPMYELDEPTPDEMYMHRISLSSSTGGLDTFMTGAQNLVFIAKLKGYPEELALFFAYHALKCMGLLTNDPLVSNYSSGCLRRLSLCSALVLGPTVAFFDEPMNSVDASSKPLVANALQRLKGMPASVIVAESTLDWRLLEPVFDRIAIMAKGQFTALGPAREILEAIAQGYSARIKLRMVTAYREDRVLGDESSDSDTETEFLESSTVTHTDKSVMFAQTLNNLKSEFLRTFPSSTLCREHLSMLFFIIPDEDRVERYSDMFRKLQALKEKYRDLIEDYYLSSVTVEDVFWRFQYEKGAFERAVSTSATALTDSD